MILDSNLIFCEGLELSTAGETDIIDLTEGGDAMCCEPVIVCLCTEDAAGGTSFTVAIETDDSDDFSAAKTLYESGDIEMADATAGTKLFAVRVPRGTKRYLRGNVTATGTFSAGAIDLFIVAGDAHGYEYLED